MKIIKYIIVLIILFKITSCDKLRKKVVDKDIVSNNKKSKPLSYFVNAKSGLNYRDIPKGEVLGLFPLNTKLQIVKHTGVFQTIKDENSVFNGEWVGVLYNQDTVYVFNSFLSPKKTIIKSVDFHSDSLDLIYSIKNNRLSKVELWSNNFDVSDKFFLSLDKNYVLITKKEEVDSQFKTTKIDTLLFNEYTYTVIHNESFKTKYINGQKYVLFSMKESFKGTAITGRDISFFMVNLKTLHFYKLVYFGEPTIRCNDCVDGDFEENKNLDAVPKLKNILYNFALESKYIYVPTEKEKNVSYYKNYVQKWYKDNNMDNTLATGHGYISDVVYSTYYKEDIFKFTGDFGSDFIENANYKVVNFYNGSLLAYDKAKEVYFPVFVESCNSACNKEIRFVTDNVIEIKYNFFEEEIFKLDIDKIIFTN